MDWLVLFGAQQLAGFAFGAVLENLSQSLGDLTKDAGEDIVKDFFKDSIKSGIGRFRKDTLAIAMGKAMAQFLYLVQQELEAAGIRKVDLQTYKPALQLFIRDSAVKAWLAEAFEPSCHALDGKRLIAVWSEMRLIDLPADFSWLKIGRVYLNRVDDIIGASQELKVLFATKQLVNLNQSAQEIVGIVPDFDLDRYRRSLRDNYDNLKLNTVDLTYSEYKTRLWSIFVPQNLREALPPPRKDYPKTAKQKPQNISSVEWEEYKRVFLDKPVKSALETLRGSECPYALILGDPGAGKSSLLQYLALDWAEKPTAEIPLLIELRQYVTDENKPKDFLEFFHQGKRKICELNQLKLGEILQAGNALVMFDGLDEIFDKHRRNGVITEIIAFTNKYNRVRVIVSSRSVGYDAGRLENAGFRHFTLDDLNEAQIREFIEKWHRFALHDDKESDRKEMRNRLQTAIKDSPAIGELAGNPLLLTMMAILNRKQTLPRNRADLYEEAAKLLLYNWDIEYKKMQLTLDDVDLGAKQAMLRRIAYYMQASHQGLKANSIQRDALEEEFVAYLKSRDVPNPRRVANQLIDQLRQRNFILCHYGNDDFGFVHRTFLEFFCAAEFVKRFSKRGTKGGGLSLKELQAEVYGKHWRDESWHEVLRLIVGSKHFDEEFAGEIINFLIRIQPVDEGVDALLLAADCYAEINNKNKIAATSEQLLQSLKLAFNQEKKIQKITEKMITIWREKTDLKAWLEDQALNHPKESVRRAIVQGMATVELPHLDNAYIFVKNIGDFFEHQNRFEEAIHAYLQLNSTDLSAIKGIIRSYRALKKYDEAIAICQQYYKPGANNLTIFASELIAIYREAGKYNEAISIYSKEIETKKDQSQRKLLFLEISYAYHQMGQYSIAMEHCEQAIAINSFPWLNSRSHNDFAYLLYDMGQYEEAETEFNKAISIDSKYKVCYNNLGYMYRSLERWDDAVCSLHMAIDLDSTYALPHVNIGLLYLLLGDLNRAESEFETAIQLNPFHGKAFLYIGMLDAMRGNMAKAKMSWQSGLERYGEHAQHHRLFRTLYTVALGHVEKGLVKLECLLNEEKPPCGLLRDVLESAKILHGCPGPIAGIENVIHLLEMGINKAPVFRMRSKQKN